MIQYQNDSYNLAMLRGIVESRMSNDNGKCYFDDPTNNSMIL